MAGHSFFKVQSGARAHIRRSKALSAPPATMWRRCPGGSAQCSCHSAPLSWRSGPKRSGS